VEPSKQLIENRRILLLCWLKTTLWEKKSLDPHFHATKRNFADEQATFKSFELKLVQKAFIVILEGEHRFLPEIKQLENQVRFTTGCPGTIRGVC
jgi:hypothetical protein